MFGPRYNSAIVRETMTVSSAGPIAADRVITVALYPHKGYEPTPTYQSLAPGVVKITTLESEDYIFAHPSRLQFQVDDIAFDGVAGAVRLYPDKVHLVIAEGPSSVTYKGVTLQSEVATYRVIPRDEAKQTRMIAEPAPRYAVTFALDPEAGPIEDIQPGVKRQTLSDGFVYAFDSQTRLGFYRDDVEYHGRRGGVVVNTNSRSARLVLLDEGRVGYKDKSAQIAKGPWEVTFEHGRVIGRSDGPGRILLMTTPDGITELPELVVDGLPCAPGTWGKTGLLVPVMPGEHTFEVRVLKQPPVWRNCQAW